MSSGADRQRSYRQRRDRGRMVLAVEISDVDVADALVADERLPAKAKDDRQAVSRAIERLVEDFVEAVASRYS